MERPSVGSLDEGSSGGGFLQQFATPVLKATRRSNKGGNKGLKGAKEETIAFYSVGAYEEWRKGLASSASGLNSSPFLPRSMAYPCSNAGEKDICPHFNKILKCSD